MRQALLPALFLIVGPTLGAHDPITTKLTWTEEISRIVYKRCAGCHTDFKTYEGARPWAKAIRDEVTARRMPPWGAVKGIGNFAGDPSLTTPEIDMLVAWVEGGAPEGDPAYLPHRIQAAEPAPVMPPYAKESIVQKELRLEKPTRLIALKPRDLKDHASLEAWAVRPDGEVDRLLWLNDYRPAKVPRYILREPAVFPAGTRLKVAGAPGAAMIFYLK